MNLNFSFLWNAVARVFFLMSRRIQNYTDNFKHTLSQEFPPKPDIIQTPEEPFELQAITPAYLLHIWKTMKKTSSTSTDVLGLAPFMINLSIEASNITEMLVNIINRSMDEFNVPGIIKNSKVIPLTKIPCPTEPSHLRLETHLHPMYNRQAY